MHLEQLKCLLAVVRLGSMNKAARELFVSQPAVTSMIKTIENELGFAVVERTPSGVFPTSDGAVVISDAKRIVAMYEKWKSISANERTVTISYFPGGCWETLLDAVADFNIVNPEYKIQLKAGENYFDSINAINSFFIMQLVPDHLARHLDNLDSVNMQSYLLFEDEFALFCSPQDELAQKPELFIDDLNGKRVAFFRNPDRFPYRDLLENRGIIKVSGYGEHKNFFQLVMNNKLVYLQPSSMWADHHLIKNGLIVHRRFSDQKMPTNYYLFHPAHERMTDFERKVFNLINLCYRAGPSC